MRVSARRQDRYVLKLSLEERRFSYRRKRDDAEKLLLLLNFSFSDFQLAPINPDLQSGSLYLTIKSSGRENEVFNRVVVSVR